MLTRSFNPPSIHMCGELFLLFAFFMMSNTLLQIHLMFIWAPIVMYWMIVETEENPNS